MKGDGNMENIIILVNNAVQVPGMMSCTIENVNGKMVGEGVFKTHYYIDEIFELECRRFRLSGIEVYNESFGSTDPFVIYRFTFSEYESFHNEIEYSEEELEKLYDEE
jgi:hypothetical protein